MPPPWQIWCCCCSQHRFVVRGCSCGVFGAGSGHLGLDVPAALKASCPGSPPLAGGESAFGHQGVTGGSWCPPTGQAGGAAPSAGFCSTAAPAASSGTVPGVLGLMYRLADCPLFCPWPSPLSLLGTVGWPRCCLAAGAAEAAPCGCWGATGGPQSLWTGRAGAGEPQIGTGGSAQASAAVALPGACAVGQVGAAPVGAFGSTGAAQQQLPGPLSLRLLPALWVKAFADITALVPLLQRCKGVAVLPGWSSEWDLDPHDGHFGTELHLVSADGALEAENACTHSLSLDAAPVEPGVTAGWAHHGVVGLAVPHRVHADDADGVLLRSCLHCLLRAVLPAEGPVLPKELGDAFSLRGAGEMEAAFTACLRAGDGGPSLATNEALLLGCPLDCVLYILQ